MNCIDSAEELAEELGVKVELVEAWSDRLNVIAARCLDTLESKQRKLALFYLTAFMVQSSQKDVTSESIDDASRSYTAHSKVMNQNPYGLMALNIAPCLASLGGSKRYAARLLR